MATTGQVAPTTATTVAEAPWSDNDWTSAGNVTADDGSTASVTAASFDSGDQTFVLKAAGFDFSSIPAGSTINGVTARINAFFRSGQGSGSLDLCQLLSTTGAKVGTNQCSTPVALTTTTSTVITKGSSSDLWGNALTEAWVKDPDFGIALGILATAANADVDIDSVTLEIDYTAPAGTHVDITAATETDTAGHLQQVHTPQVTSDTDTAQPLSFSKPIHKTLGVAAESDAAQLLDFTAGSGSQSVSVLPAAETDTAQALDADKQVTIGPASGTNTAQALSFSQASDHTVTPASETDTAQALAFSKPIHVTLGVAAESDDAQTLTHSGPLALAPTSETDTAQALGVSKPIHKTLGVATETSTAGTLQQVHSVTPVSETDAAQALDFETSSTQVSITPVVETDTAQALSLTLVEPTQVTLGVAGQIVGPPPLFEFLPSDVAQALTVTKAVTLGVVDETDTAQPVTAAGNHALSPAAESDDAQALTFSKPIHKTIGPVTSTGTAQALSVSKTVTVGTVAETNTARALSFSQATGVAITPAAQTETAQALTVSKHVSLTFAVETDTAVRLPIGPLVRFGDTTTGLSEVSARTTGLAEPAPATGLSEVSARATGLNEPVHVTGVSGVAHVTGISEAAHATGVDEVLTNTGIVEVAI